MHKNSPNKLVLEDNLKAIIHVNLNNQSGTNQRLDLVEASIKNMYVEVE